MWHWIWKKRPKDGQLCVTMDRNGWMTIERYYKHGDLGEGFYMYTDEVGEVFDHSVIRWCKIPHKWRK